MSGIAFSDLYSPLDPPEARRAAVRQRIERQTRAALQMLLDEEGASDSLMESMMAEAQPVIEQMVDEWFRNTALH